MRLVDVEKLAGEAICLYTYGGARFIPLDALKRAPTVEQPRWVSVAERLPELKPCSAGTAYSEAVIVWTAGKKMMVAVWDGIDFMCAADYWDAEGDEILYWMDGLSLLALLPEPPKEDDHG